MIVNSGLDLTNERLQKFMMSWNPNHKGARNHDSCLGGIKTALVCNTEGIDVRFRD